jgi:transposase InsO family protein
VVKTTKDRLAAKELEAAHAEHPFYGVRRLALHLGWSQNKTRRIRRLAGVVVPTASKRHKYRRSGQAEIPAPPNFLHSYAVFKNSGRPQDGMDYSAMVNAEAWVQDFTYVRFQQSFCYLATVLNLKTREIVGWRLGTNHSSELTYSALLDALSKHRAPAILHSDQGSEYLSHKHQLLCERLEIRLSASAKSSPWQNGFMERFMLTHKLEVGSLSRYADLGELNEAIALHIHYYNTKRIHLALKTTPEAYAKQLTERDNLFAKTGA